MFRLTRKNLAANRLRFALTTFAVVLALYVYVIRLMLRQIFHARKITINNTVDNPDRLNRQNKSAPTNSNADTQATGSTITGSTS